MMHHPHSEAPDLVLPLSGIPSGRVDEDTAALLDAVGTDWTHERDIERIDAAIRQCAAEHDGQVVPHWVQPHLLDRYGQLDVNPRVLSARYGVLARAGVLVPTGWVVSEDHRGGNAGRPTRTYDYVAQAVA